MCLNTEIKLNEQELLVVKFANPIDVVNLVNINNFAACIRIYAVKTSHISLTRCTIKESTDMRFAGEIFSTITCYSF